VSGDKTKRGAGLLEDDEREEETVQLPPGRCPPCFRRARLLITSPDVAVREFVTDLPEIRVGGDPSNDVCLDDPHVSRRHCEIRQTPSGFLLRDLGSTNGTFASGLQLREAVLPSGAVVTVGRTHIQLLAEGENQSEFLPTDEESFGAVVGRSARMRQIFALLQKIAPTDLTVCLIGETGTGKELFAHALHEHSKRAAGPFVVIDCSAVAPNLIESELFGHEKGAFTGADRARAGAFERAHGGTVFLDEIGELPLELQPKLLRVLEQRVLKPVGGGQEIPVDVRILAASNRNLELESREGRFREDLFFRLSVLTVEIPCLRERREDLPLLAQRIIDQRVAKVALADDALAALQNYDWPGNVRELRNVIDRTLAVLDGPTLRASDLLFFEPRAPRDSGEAVTPAGGEAPLAGRTLEEVEREALAQTLASCGGNKAAAARALGIAPSTLYQKIRKHGLA
jgi:DNA-binding NtrC family response regulator